MIAGVEGYLARLGIVGRPAPTLASLATLHRAHLDVLPYENLAIMLGRPDPADPVVTLARVSAGGNAGYCFHHNGLVELVLRELGYDVVRRPGAQLEADGPSGTLDHLVLEVRAEGGRWWPDLGYGDGFRTPLELRSGAVAQGPFSYRLEDVGEDGWRFRQDPRGSFLGTEVGPVGVSDAAIAAAHRRLPTPPGGDFTRLLVVQRRDDTGAETLRGIRHVRVGEDAFARDLASFDDWRAALLALGVSLTAVGDQELRGLHDRMRAAHGAWAATR